MGLVKVVVQLKNDITELKPEQYISVVQVHKSVFHFKFKVYEIQFKALELYSWLIYCIDLWPQSVGMVLRDLIHNVDDILPTLHESVRTEVQYTVYCVFSSLNSLSSLIFPIELFLLLVLEEKVNHKDFQPQRKQRGNDHFMLDLLARDN